MGGGRRKQCCAPCEDITICGVLGSPGIQTTGSIGTTGTAYISFPLTFSSFNYGVNPKLLKGGRTTIISTATTALPPGTIFDLGTFGTGVLIASNGGISFVIDEAEYISFWEAFGLISAPPPTLTNGTVIQVSLTFQSPIVNS
jgi:hypothetical protein